MIDSAISDCNKSLDAVNDRIKVLKAIDVSKVTEGQLSELATAWSTRRALMSNINILGRVSGLLSSLLE